jgi:hypothetical protein
MRNAGIGVLLLLLVTWGAAAQRRGGSKSANLRQKTRSELVECFSAADNCGAQNPWEIADALGKPKNESFLLSAFPRRKNADQRLGIIHSLYRINDPEVAAFFKKLVRERFDDGEELYYPLNYLAKRCDPEALRELSGNGRVAYKGYPGCLQWATTVKLFGQCNYRPAIPFLIGSINAACMNIGIAAVESLEKMYPRSPSFDKYSIDEIQRYFERRAASESNPNR